MAPSASAGRWLIMISDDTKPLPRWPRGGSTKTASDLALRKTLNAKKCDLLTFRKREIPSRTGRRSEHRWWHPCSVSGAHSNRRPN
jgi:hypothetical protein